VIDLDPMLVTARVAERDVHLVNTGSMATGVFSDGHTVTGPITFVGRQADPTTRTYRVEVQVDNKDRAVRSGITTEVVIPVATVLAHKVNPSLFALDETGAIGVRTLSNQDVVDFYRVDVFDDDENGVWVTGLPDTTRLITVGQELVTRGDRADPVMEKSGLAPPDVSREMRSTAGPFDRTELGPRTIGAAGHENLDDV
jgi:multidrug efflux system membrane fusion protein